MMLVPCYVAPSSIEGQGLFSAEPINSGDEIYRFDPEFDKVFSREYLETIPKQTKEFIRRYTIAHPEDRNKLVLDSDEGRFMNHSRTPNVDFTHRSVGVALNFIPPGTELTADYKYFKRRSAQKPKKLTLDERLKLSDEKGVVPTITISSKEQANEELSNDNLEAGIEFFKRHGTLLIENAFPVSLIDEAKDIFFTRYARYFSDKKHKNALRVGDKRFMITLELEAPFNNPAFFGSPMLLPIMYSLLSEECILSGMTCITSLPGSQNQRLHKDHSALFPDYKDLLLPPLSITVIVPLIDLDEKTGTTRLLKGSHKVGSREAKKMEHQDPIVKKGSCFLMDLRLSHQGLANNSDGPRPIVSLDYQRPWFRDYMNFNKQEPLLIGDTDLESLPRRHRKLIE
ncbi:MAG: hypothetical protein ACI9XK_003097 [Granulosicoccus sp.]|jgi:hypothetical protein